MPILCGPHLTCVNEDSGYCVVEKDDAKGHRAVDVAILVIESKSFPAGIMLGD